MIMRCGRQGWSPRRPNLICHNPSVTAIVSRVRVLLAHQGMSLPDALAPADVRLPAGVMPVARRNARVKLDCEENWQLKAISESDDSVAIIA